jgi:hypothetical protein
MLFRLIKAAIESQPTPSERQNYRVFIGKRRSGMPAGTGRTGLGANPPVVIRLIEEAGGARRVRKTWTAQGEVEGTAT